MTAPLKSSSFRFSVVTRFAMDMGPKSPVSDIEQWLNHRWILFREYCLPSIEAQVYSNFTWYLLVGRHIDSIWKRRLERVSDQVDIRVIESYSDIEHGNEEWYLTLRLDNDDAIHRMFIQLMVNDFLSHPSPRIMSFRTGAQVSHRTGQTRLFSWDKNPFICRVTRGHGHVYDKTHNGWGDAMRLINPRDAPMWLQVIHDRNWANVATGIPCRLNLEAFGLTDFQANDVS